MSLQSPETRSDALDDTQPKVGRGGRLRASMACAACRVRKCRCDGLKPACSKCKLMRTECSYDVEVKRRGPDKVPGGRQLALLARRSTGSLLFARPTQIKPYTHKPKPSAFTSKPRDPLPIHDTLDYDENAKPSPPGLFPFNSPNQYIGVGPPNRSPTYLGSAPLINDIQNINTLFTGSNPDAISSSWSNKASPDEGTVFDFSPHTQLLEPISVEQTPSPVATLSGSLPVTAYLEDEDEDEELQKSHLTSSHTGLVHRSKGQHGLRFSLVTGPGNDFIKKTWWDDLLNLYGPDRTTSFNLIYKELLTYFRDAYLCVSLHNTTLFLRSLFDPNRRATMQPSLVLSWLALAKLYRSSERGDGEAGRAQAMKMRDAAQATLEASMNTGWTDPALAQAAWVLVNFENWAHPLHSMSRINSALALLESLIRGLRLTYLDVNNQRTSVFRRNEIPSVPRSSLRPAGLPQSCDCDSVSLQGLNPKQCDITPLWSTGPGWDPNWTDAEIRQEECRRLVWATHHAILRQVTFTMSIGRRPPEFMLTDPFYYSVLFEGEALLSSKFANHPNESFYTKESVWSLYARTSLLWGLCLRMNLGLIPGFNPQELGPEEYDSRYAAFSLDVWLETLAIEHALDEHTCAPRNTYALFSREYISNIRRIVTNDYTSNVPYPNTNMNAMFNQKLAWEWLSNHIATANVFLDGKLFETDLSANVELLSKKPVFQFWFSTQISRCLALWEDDPSLTIALDLCKGLVPPMEHLVKVWPCAEREEHWRQLRNRLEDALYIASASAVSTPTDAGTLIGDGSTYTNDLGLFSTY